MGKQRDISVIVLDEANSDFPEFSCSHLQKIWILPSSSSKKTATHIMSSVLGCYRIYWLLQDYVDLADATTYSTTYTTDQEDW